MNVCRGCGKKIKKLYPIYEDEKDAGLYCRVCADGMRQWVDLNTSRCSVAALDLIIGNQNSGKK